MQRGTPRAGGKDPLVVPEAAVTAAPQHRACCEEISRGAFEHVLSLAGAVIEYHIAGKGYKKGTPREAGEKIAQKYGITIRRIQQLGGEIINKTLWRKRAPSVGVLAAEAERAAWLEEVVKGRKSVSRLRPLESR